MNPIAAKLLSMPSRSAIGQNIKFRHPRTNRTRRAQIASISGAGVRIQDLEAKSYFIIWSDILGIV